MWQPCRETQSFPLTDVETESLKSGSVGVPAQIALAVSPVSLVHYARLPSELLDFQGTKEMKFFHVLGNSFQHSPVYL